MRFRHLSLVLVLACAVTACGGGGDTPTPTPTSAGNPPVELNTLPPTAYPGQLDQPTAPAGYPGEAATPAP